MSDTHTFEIGDYDNGWKEHLCSVCAELQSNPIHAQPLSPSPEIRYQLRNWHHVTCAGFGGQACTCLAQREALISEIAGKRQ